MSQTGTPTEFLKLGITEPDDTLNVLVDLNGQWQKIDTGVKNVDTKANTNASGISALNTAVQDNTENITNILETNVNQQTSIDTLQSKVATLEEDDTSYGTRITAVEAGVQENSELINDLEVDLSGVKTSVGTVPEGSNLQGEVNGLDTRVTALENSGSVAAVEARVTTLETEVGTVPAGETVQGQITTLNGQVNSGNIPFRFSVDGEGNYGYLKADDSFVPFRSGSPTEIDGHRIITLDSPVGTNDGLNLLSPSICRFTTTDSESPYYHKYVYLPTGEIFDRPNEATYEIGPHWLIGTLNNGLRNFFYYDVNTHSTVKISDVYAICSGHHSITYYTKETNKYTLHYIDLTDNTNNTTLELPLQVTQSTTKGRLAMAFNAYENKDDFLISYFNNSTGESPVQYISYENSELHYGTTYGLSINRINNTNIVLQYKSGMYDYSHPKCFGRGNNSFAGELDCVFTVNQFDYIKVGTSFIEL